MDFGELITEVAARGFNDLLDGSTEEERLKRWINQATRELDDLQPWPYLHADKSGTAPLTIEDLAHVLSVSNVTTDEELGFLDERQVTAYDPKRTESGSAEYWFRSNLTTIGVYPLDTSSEIVVRYVKTTPTLSASTDTPLSPSGYHDLIVDGATVRAYKNRDNFEAAQFVRQEWERGTTGMKHSLMKVNYDHDRVITRTGLPIDYLG